MDFKVTQHTARPKINIFVLLYSNKTQIIHKNKATTKEKHNEKLETSEFCSLMTY